MNLRQAIVFAILMENNKGILSKSPRYVEEQLKFTNSMNKPEILLDAKNLAKFNKWKKEWDDKLANILI